MSFESDEAILSQQAHFCFSVIVCGSLGAVGVASCAHETAVRARMRANSACFIIFSWMNSALRGVPAKCTVDLAYVGLQGSGLRRVRRELRCEAPYFAGKEEKYPEQRLRSAALAKGSYPERLCARTKPARATVSLA